METASPLKELNTNKISESKLNGFPAEKAQDKEETNSTGEENARTPSPQEELEELNAELEVIQDDSKYVEFLENCHHMKDEKSVLIPEEDEEKDPDFDGQKLFSTVQGQICGERREAENEDSSSSDESEDSSSDDEEQESFLEVDEKEAAIGDLKVPKDLKEKNAKAFPPFWRLKRQMEILDSKKDQTEDPEDPDFVHEEKEDEEIDSDSSDSSSEEEEDGQDDIDTSVTAVKAAEEEEDMGEDELASLVEELKINEVVMEDFEGEEDLEEDEVEEETAEAAAEEIWYDAVNKDQSGYQSGEDPDYEVPEGAIQVVDLSSDSEDSEDDSDDEIEEAQRME